MIYCVRIFDFSIFGEKRMKTYKMQKNTGERGNILFLILIAVALFAALSYAVTSSTRGGAGNANSEINEVTAAQLSQYPSGVRTSILRMIISQGVAATELEFDPPADFDGGSSTYGVFHPSAGGAQYTIAQPDAMEDGTQGTWLFNSRYQVLNIGTDSATTDNSGNEIIAFLPGVKLGICTELNAEHGIGATDDDDDNGVGDSNVLLANIPTAAMNMDALNTGIGADPSTTHVIGASADEVDFTGQAFGCADFDDANSGNTSLVYYHVLVER
jgi:hypothetical protein